MEKWIISVILSTLFKKLVTWVSLNAFLFSFLHISIVCDVIQHSPLLSTSRSLLNVPSPKHN